MRYYIQRTGCFLLFLLACTPAPIYADVSLPSIFSDNMVLQQGKPIPVYGTAAPAEKVIVEIGGQQKETTADAAGKWQVILDSLSRQPAPTTMRVAGENVVQIKNVLIGDVWLASGQSNMEMRVREVNNAAEEIRNANYPEIRFFMVKRDMASAPRKDTAGEWLVCSPETVQSFSAVAYFFAREIHNSYGIPIGVINSAVGASSCEAWTPREVLAADKSLPAPSTVSPTEYPDWKTYIAVRKQIYDSAAHKDPGIKPECLAWGTPEYDVSGWKEMRVPGNFEAQGLNIDGAVWFRTEVDLPANWAGKDAQLYLSLITQNSVAYVNGTEIARTENNGRQYVFRTHKIPGKLVKAGRNVIAVRIFNEIDQGGFYPSYPAPLKVYQQGAGEVMLPKVWKYKVELGLEPAKMSRRLPFGYKVPSALYNAMIAPYTKYPIRGFLWYQGESNAGRAEQHTLLFPAMIRSWRKLWGDDSLPFYFVQLASYQKRETEPGEGGWAWIRESQAKTLDLPHTGMAVTIDIGDATNVHPKNKQDVGKRLALWAKRDCYGDTDTVVSGPQFYSATVEGDRIRIKFKHPGGGLKSKGEEMKGFAVAGPDKVFRWAKAKIDGDSVLVWNESIPKPAFVRYAWATNPECSLYNAAGLPAVPFRTDK
ncbi:Glycosyl hydrolases family 2, sugar binding domain [Gimesia panareensis]|uniref:Glycosyl hydrolases family 2, sugar binding domain n=1 Tax=Gimesia panareensis TaxID=2527978 RepID=A0A517Q441_9PLAN|nr:sialate O-acetylesterase [Gimesia panareensis]QDT26401.1 Glycosyl hydrolases family 2, sugar binding domain [Gimesia panareensis]